MTTLRVPSEKDWGDTKGDLDVEYARKLFLGKTTEEVQPHFERCVIERADELRFMPPVPFRYYVLAFRDFVLSKKLMDGCDKATSWAPDAASCFLSLILEKLEKAPDVIMPVMPDLIEAAEHVAAHQSTYRAKPEIYGNFGSKIRKIRQLWKANNQNA